MGGLPHGDGRGSPGKLTAAVTAQYKPAPEVAEGFLAEDYWEDPVEVWPENWETMLLFSVFETQWNWVVGVGGGGRTGLKYEVVYPYLDRITKGDENEWSRLFADIQQMEQAALAAQHLKQ